MELWFIYTLLSSLLAGLFTFGLKIAAEKDLQANLLTAVYFSTSAVLSCGAWLVTGQNSFELINALIIGAVLGVLSSSLYVIQIQGLKYIDAALFYPIYKTLGPLLVIVAGVVYFSEDLSQFEYFALALSLLIPLMLISKGERDRQKDLWKGVMVLLVCAAVAALIAVLAKFAIDRSIDVYLLLLVQMVFGFGTNVVIGYVRKQPLKLGALTSNYITYGMILGVLMFSFIAFSLLAFKDGLVSIVYTVQSFYILIPIVLSVIIYKEHMNVRKALAIVLSVLAIIFFHV
jgi:uncharacterized membrane protein